MKISLVTSLHLDHGCMSPDSRAGARPTMQEFVPIGLLSLKAAADRELPGTEVRVTEVNGAMNAGHITNDDRLYDRIAKTILRGDDDMVGLMTDADSLHHTIAIAEKVKQRRAEVFVCLGGPAASPIGRTILQAFPFIDCVVRGEGEITFTELIRCLQKGLPLDEVLGITWRRHDEIIENPERTVIADLDSLPVPAFDAYDMTARPPLYLDVGRGCPFDCTFCGTAPFWKRVYRMKSIDRILREMKLVRDDFGYRRVNFSHDIFTCDREWTLRFCEALQRSRLNMTWTCSTRTDVITRELLDEMAAAGCAEIYYGIETGSAELQKSIRKNLDLDRVKNIVADTVAAGIRPITGFIVGYPNETTATMGDTLEAFFKFLEIGGFRAHLFTLCPYHDSPMYRQHGEHSSEPAESYDVPLSAAPAQHIEELRRLHPGVFASTTRYRLLNEADDLVAASEEISPKLVVLKSIWPLLLPHYQSALHWFRDWTRWIEAHNLRERPQTQWPHQGTVADVLHFICDEITRLGLEGSDLHDLVRYERMKLDASSLKVPASPPRPQSPTIAVNTVVVRRCDYIASRFHRNIRHLVSGKSATTHDHSDERWIVCVKDNDGTMRTLELPLFGKLVLDITDHPRRIADVFSSIVEDAPATAVADTLPVFLQLISEGLLQEASE